MEGNKDSKERGNRDKGNWEDGQETASKQKITVSLNGYVTRKLDGTDSITSEIMISQKKIVRIRASVCDKTTGIEYLYNQSEHTSGVRLTSNLHVCYSYARKTNFPIKANIFHSCEY